MHPILILCGVLWLVFWSLLSWLAWRADAGLQRDVFDWMIALPVAAFILIPALGFILAGCGITLNL